VPETKGKTLEQIEDIETIQSREGR
jgi:hypothetical protein